MWVANGGDSMSREKELYRENLELIREHFGDKQLLPVKEVAEYLGINVATVRKHFHKKLKKVGRCYYMSAAILASELS